MKVTIFNGCREFSVSVDDIRIIDSDIQSKKSLLIKMINTIEDLGVIDFMIKDMASFIDADVYENKNCNTCGDYIEYIEYQLD